MAKDRTYPGEKTTERLVDRSQLKRVNVPGGGEAFKGPTATRALKALGARAMTVDKSIIVDEDFDPNQAQDAALFAHEQVHVERGSTRATHAVHDAEEVAARAAEEHVLQRMASPSASSDQGPNVQSEQPQQAPPASPMERAVGQLMASGKNRNDMVEDLARQVVDRLADAEDLSHQRGGNTPGGQRH